jgi:type VI protein secretion system component VasK
MPVRLLAENLPLDPGIPPWITLAFVALWLGIVVMAWLLWQRRRANRRALREEQRHSTSARRAAPPDDRQLGPGKDVEIW